MNYFLDLVYQLITRPRLAMRTITKGEKLGQAAILWLFVIVMTSFTTLIEGPGILTRLLFCLCGFGLSLVLHSAVIDYCAGFMGGRGSARGITAGFLAASLPYGFTVFGGVLSLFGLTFLESLLGTAVVVWSFILDVLAISENYGFSTSRAIGTACIPAVLGAVFVLCLFLLGMAAAVAGLSQIGGAGMTDVLQSF